MIIMLINCFSSPQCEIVYLPRRVTECNGSSILCCSHGINSILWGPKTSCDQNGCLRCCCTTRLQRHKQYDIAWSNSDNSEWTKVKFIQLWINYYFLSNRLNYFRTFFKHTLMRKFGWITAIWIIILYIYIINQIKVKKEIYQNTKIFKG